VRKEEENYRVTTRMPDGILKRGLDILDVCVFGLELDFDGGRRSVEHRFQDSKSVVYGAIERNQQLTICKRN
jgi:hypothetical protein